MFLSACSLRSTQCAALIALATAAGIMRIEPTESRTAGKPAPELNPKATTVTARSDVIRGKFYEMGVHHFALWQFFISASPASRLAAPDGAQLAPTNSAPGGQHAPVFAADNAVAAAIPVVIVCTSFPFARSELALSAQRHSFPYAIGPPTRKISSTRRVVGTAVPGDSAPRRIQFEEFASDFIAVAAPLSSRLPSFALRGTPASVLRSLPFACDPGSILSASSPRVAVFHLSHSACATICAV